MRNDLQLINSTALRVGRSIYSAIVERLMEICYNVLIMQLEAGDHIMGIFLNPGNDSFAEALNSEIYVDKSGLISITNKRIKTKQKYICVSRPRRFGKSVNLGMLAAYYSKGCDSRELFDGLAVSKDEGYPDHLNKYNVIYLNMQQFLSSSKDINDMLGLLKTRVIKELLEEYPGSMTDPDDLAFSLEEIYTAFGEPFVFLIDEWDCVMRENMDNKDAQKIYLDFIRNLLKDKTYVALAYMTGILPIKKYGSHSALNMFREYSMLKSAAFSRFSGFTNIEVRKLCKQQNMDFDLMQAWYDGYKLDNTELYCPNSVVQAIEEQSFDSYWTKTEVYEALSNYIAMNYDGLHDTVEKLLAGEEIEIDTGTFQNDMVTFHCADDVLTLLVHLGYLAYRSDTKCIYIPNKEVRDEFVRSMKITGLWKETIGVVLRSKQLLADTLLGKERVVADCIRHVHEQNSSILNYNNEQSLRFIVLIAYYYAREQYNIIQELPAGEGFADIVFVPRPFVDITKYPPMVVELKWNKTADAAIAQIKNKKYPDALQGYNKTLLVGINYDKDTKEH